MNGAAMSVEFAKGRRDNGGGGRDRDGRGIFYLSLTPDFVFKKYNNLKRTGNQYIYSRIVICTLTLIINFLN